MASDTQGFVAYSSQPEQIGEVVESAVACLKAEHGMSGISTWRQNAIAGRFVVDPVIENIEKSDFVVADITRLNFNVAYEVGYAIGWRRRVLLVKNDALIDDAETVRKVGIFDTLGNERYSTAAELVQAVLSTTSTNPVTVTQEPSRSSPVYVVLPRRKADDEIRLISRIKKARMPFRSFDPEEQGRLGAREAIDNVAQSHGVAIQLLDPSRVGSDTHNLRAAFVAGLASALGKELLLLQRGDAPVPLDYRDLVTSYQTEDRFNVAIGEFAAAVAARLTAIAPQFVAKPATFLAGLSLGASAAENELQELSGYYLETDEYHRSLRGEVQIVAGRKGSGKTALFVRLRDQLRGDKTRIVLDLRPEGYQLVKFKETVLDLMEEGTREHTITAFWEYLLLLETCHKLLEKDRKVHLRNYELFEPYRALDVSYSDDELIAEADFAERLLKLTARISDDVQAAESAGEEVSRLSRERITEFLYKHDVAELRERLIAYLQLKNGLWILFDNLDKGWPPHGLQSSDLVTLRCLLDALAKLERSLRRNEITCHGIVFIRNDVYELLVDNTPDRGKISTASVDWSDDQLLRELVRRRLLRGGVEGNPDFPDLWTQICVSHVEGEESSQYLIDRCLMRPRSLIDLIQSCRSHAVNLGKERIELEDVLVGEEAYSTGLVTDISYEIRDIFPEAEDVLYEFIEAPARLRQDQIHVLLEGYDETNQERLVDLLLWYGFLGLEREAGEVTYVYSVNHDLTRLKKMIGRRKAGNAVFEINPAFWRGLEIVRSTA